MGNLSLQAGSIHLFLHSQVKSLSSAPSVSHVIKSDASNCHHSRPGALGLSPVPGASESVSLGGAQAFLFLTNPQAHRCW